MAPGSPCALSCGNVSHGRDWSARGDVLAAGNLVLSQWVSSDPSPLGAAWVRAVPFTHTPRGRLLAKEQAVITHLSYPPTKPLPPWSHPPDTPPTHTHTHALPISGCLFRSIPRFRSPSAAWSEMLITRRSSSSRLLRLVHSFLRLPPPRLRPPHAASLRS